MADIVIRQIEEGMTGRQVADLLYSNFLALAGAIGSGGGGDIPTADIEKGVTAYGWGDHRQAGYLKGITGGMVTSALGYTPADAAGITANANAIGVLQGYFTNGVAKSAAKLATSRKLWGQLFNGEADVTGALTGVTDITASGVLTIGKIKIGDGVIEWDAANGGFKVSGGLWATDYLSSKGVNTGASGGGSSYQRLDTWDGYTTAKDGWVLSAKLGYGLKTTQDDILRQLADISGQGTNVTFTPALTSGTQIGTLTIDGEPVKMYAPSIPTDDINKGVTAYGWGDHRQAGYLTQHQDLSGYQTKITDSNKLSSSLVSGLAAVATSGKYSDLSGTPTSLPASDVSAWAKAASKPTYKFSEITDKPTTIGGYGITDAYTKSQVDSALGGYLPLSGGTLEGKESVLSLNSSTNNVWIYFKASGINKASVGHYNDFTSVANEVSGGRIGVGNNGVAQYWNNANGSIKYDLIHSGNIGNQSVDNATNFSNHNIGEFALYGDGGSYIAFNLLDPSLCAKGQGEGYIEFYGYGKWYNSVWGKVTAFDGFVGNLSGNAASATKLQTARTIWGQSFNGTGDIVGVLASNTTKDKYRVAYNVYYQATEMYASNLSVGDQIGMNVGQSYAAKKMAYLGYYQGADDATTRLTLGLHSVDNIIIANAIGNVGIGTTSPQYKLDVNGVIHSNEGIFSDGYVSAKGQNTSSDMRLKRVLEEVTLSVEDIAAAPAFRFAWKGGGGVDVGTSAQYWEKLVPDAVKRDDAGWRMMQYGNVAMVALISLARCVKELEEKLNSSQVVSSQVVK